MAAPFDKNDDGVVVVIGTGAGGGVLANELAQKGVSVVALEAGGRYLPDDYLNDEWASFVQLAWLDARTTSGSWRVAKDFAGLPAWIVKAVGGTTVHWAGASLRFQPHEWKAAHDLWRGRGGEPARLADRRRRDGPLVHPRRGQAAASPAPVGAPGLPGQQQLPGLRERRQGARLLGGPYRPDGDQLGRQ